MRPAAVCDWLVPTHRDAARSLALLRQSIYSRLAGCRLAGYEDVNDAERLCLDPALRTVVGGRGRSGVAAPAAPSGFVTPPISCPHHLTGFSSMTGTFPALACLIPGAGIEQRKTLQLKDSPWHGRPAH
jgi:hypothetical protein